MSTINYDFFYSKRSNAEIAALIEWAINETFVAGKPINENPYAYGVLTALDFLFGNSVNYHKGCRGELSLYSLHKAIDMVGDYPFKRRLYTPKDEVPNPKYVPD